MKSQYRKHYVIRLAICVGILLIVSFLLPACSNDLENSSTDSSNFTVQTPSLPLKSYESEFLYENIPVPEGADVFVLNEFEDDKNHNYFFSLENFDMQEAKDYVKTLENSLITREMYDEYDKNDYPMLNYVGHTKDGVKIMLTQCDTIGGIEIHIDKK